VSHACAKGNASLWASGSDPGFIAETLMLALLSVQRDVELIEIEEFGDLSRRPSAHGDVMSVARRSSIPTAA
jgi:4-hydroxy-tetrahydrodipicolinate reductase